MRKAISVLFIGTMMLGISGTAFAEDYSFESEKSGSTFYKITSTSEDHIADSSEIIVGMDGTTGNDSTKINTSSSPYSAVNVAVGEYPLAYGEETDIAIAQNTNFLNELGPTSQNRTIYSPLYQAISVDSGTLPTNSSIISGSIPYVGLGIGDVILAGLKEGTKIGTLKISKRGISANVYEGATTAQMNKGIGHFSCTPLWGGNIAFAGHNRGSHAYFLKLKNVKKGDKVVYSTVYGKRTYKVTEIKTVSTKDTSGLLQDGTEKITMYTCKENKPNVKLCVIATLVK